jgi:hypothetical protein
MGIFDWFRAPPPIADRSALVDFLDSRAAFLAQKSIFDYTRGRSGPFFSQIIREQAFVDRVDEARWRTYPFGLSLVAEMVHGALLPLAGETVPLASALRDCALQAFDRYPVPAPLGREAWDEQRSALAHRVESVALHPPKPVKDIPIPFARVFFDNMPIHEDLRTRDFELIRDHVRTNLISINRDFLKRADLSALVRELLDAAGRTAA